MEDVLVRLSEAQLRYALTSWLGKRTDSSGTRLIEELAVGRGSARVDVAAISDRLEGFEIKSDYDNVGRLSNQIHAFNRVFDRVSLVSGVEFGQVGLRILPPWWGVLVARTTRRGSLDLEWARRPEPNPVQDAHSVAELLWRDEAAGLLSQVTGQPCAARATKREIFGALASSVPLPHLRTAVCATLRARTAWRTPAP